MNKFMALILPAVIAASSFSASADIAPAAANSALAQSGAKIASPAKQTAEDKDEAGLQENSSKDSVK